MCDNDILHHRNKYVSTTKEQQAQSTKGQGKLRQASRCQLRVRQKGHYQEA